MLEVMNNNHQNSVSGLNGVSYLTDDEALQILFKANTPQNDQVSYMNHDLKLGEPEIMTQFPRLMTAVSRATTTKRKSKHRSFHTSQQKLEDEEALKTKRFWENWAIEATRSLLSDLYNEDEDEKKQLVFSGRCGAEPKYKMQRSESKESVVTNISLFACSELGLEKRGIMSRARRKKKVKKQVPGAPNWEMFAKEKKGVLDQFIKADASRIEGYMKNRTAPIQNVIQKSKATDIMTKHERKMLIKCAYSRGLVMANESKSYSTENIVNVIKPELNDDQETNFDDDQSLASHDIESLGEKYELNRLNSIFDNDFFNYGNFMKQDKHYKPTGRTPSPRAVVEETKALRSGSALAGLNSLKVNQTPSRCTSASEDSFMMLGQSFSRTNLNEESSASSPAPTTAIATTILRRQSHIHGFINLEGDFSNKVRKRIQTTLKGLNKATGYGDRKDSCKLIEEEHGLYTDADYAKHPRYPQNIRIAPSLSRVIREDIRERMGRPRRHEVRINDLQAYDSDQPKLGRSHRNLMIFNWLNALSQTGYGDMDVPEIKDLEGAPPVRTYTEFVPGIVGEMDDEYMSEGRYKGTPTTIFSRFAGGTNYASSRLGGATNYEPSRFGGTTYYEGSDSEDNESESTSEDSYYN